MNRKGNIKKKFALFVAIAMLTAVIPFNGITSQASAKKATKVTLSKSSGTMFAGGTLKLKVKKVSPTGASKAVTWKTSNKKAAAVTASGVVKAKKAGTVRITAISKANSRAKASCKITIYNKTKKLQLISSRSYTLSVGESLQLKAKVTSPYGKTQPIQWTSNNASVARISKKGLVKALSKGSAKMTAVSGGKRVSVNITVEEPDIPTGYIVTFDAAGGSAVANQTVEGGSTAVKPADPVRGGYTFGGWYTDSRLTEAYDFASAVTGNITLYAKWEAVSSLSHKVIFNTNGGNAVTEQTIRTGEKVSKPVDPVKIGFEFAGWYTDSVLKTVYDFDTAVTQDITLYARWKDTNNGTVGGSNYVPSLNPSPSVSVYTVTFNSNGGSAVASRTVAAGGKVVKPEDPTREGYTFAGWFVDESLSRAFDFAGSLSSNLTLYAKWVQNADQEGGNGVTREQWMVALSALFDLPQTADEQHSFDDFAEVENRENRDKIEASIRRGFVQLKSDTDNMVFFKPKESATKEFAAYTAIRALELSQAGTSEDPKWADAADLVYPKEDLLAINAGIVQMNGDRFDPNAELTDAQMEQALNAVKQILARASVSGEPHGEISYVDGVSETEIVCELNEAQKTISTNDTAKTADWQAGEVHVIKSSDGSQDIAVKIRDIRTEGGKTVIQYEVPELAEVVQSFDISGSANTQGTLIPAEGVTITDAEQIVSSRAVTSGKLPLFGKKNIVFNNGDFSVSGSIDIKNLEYRFAASPSWHIVTIDEVYLALNSSVELKAAYTMSVEKDERTKIATIANVSLGYGFVASGEIYLILHAGGKVELQLELTQKAGVQYAKNHGIRPVYNMDIHPGLQLQAELKGGLAVELNVNFLTLIKLAAVGTEGGIAAEGTPENLSVSPFQFCMDIAEYMFLTTYAQIGPDKFNIRLEHEIFNSDNSIFKAQQHFEETGFVPECTRGSGDYEGYVKRADNDVPIHNAKIQVVQGRSVKDTTYSDVHGKFKGLKLKKGTYKIRVSAAGYRPYEQTFQIVGGQTTALETQLMIANEEELAGRTCSGMITDAYTGIPLAGASIEVRSNFLFGTDEIIARTVSSEDGTFMFHAPTGSYKVKVTKENYVDNTIDVVIIRDRDNLSIFLSPKNQQPVEGGNLRAVLHWGMMPEDLDSHMIGPVEGGGTFHVYYEEMEKPPVRLDVDDTDGEGPETISVSEMAEGGYSYYIHDFTNRNESSSVALSNSGAYIELYTGNTLLYRINVPQNKEGTVWHVFDYDTKTGRVQLVNAFSYESDPKLVGSLSDRMGRSSREVYKDYELEGRD